MRNVLGAVAVALITVPAVRADEPFSITGAAPVTRGPTVRQATRDPYSGTAVPAVTRLHPVIGSVQRTSLFTNPLTHKARYTGLVYNPLLGSFGTQKFKR